MQLPGFLWSAVLVGVTAFLVAAQEGAAGELDTFYGPIVVAVIAAALKAVQAYREEPTQTAGARSIEQRKSRKRKWLLG